MTGDDALLMLVVVLLFVLCIIILCFFIGARGSGTLQRVAPGEVFGA